MAVQDESNVDEGTKDGYQSDDDILAQARREYRQCQDAEGTNRTDALDDLRFLLGGENQWDPRAVASRRADGRPIITINDLPAILHQVTNDQRQNRPSIKVHPVDDNTDIETAKVVQGMIRHIEYDSNADVAYDRAVNSAASIGFGYWYLDTEYETSTSRHQKIVYRSVRNHLAVHIDPMSIEPDGSDQQFAFIETLMSREDFKNEYPDAKANDRSLFTGNSAYSGWLSDTSVLVARYYCIKKKEEEVVFFSNGEDGFKSDLVSMPEGVSIIGSRTGERRTVMVYKITGADVLEKTEIKCKWIPVFPVYGDEVDVEGKINRFGLIRNAKGPAQAYNVMMSGATEEVSLRTKAPYIGAEGQFEGHEDEWMQANNRSFPFLEYVPKALDGKLAPAPQRQAMADIPTGMLAMSMHAQDNKKKVTGLYDPSLGNQGTANSGKQELAQQREGDMANSHYSDGLLRTLRHCGRCIVSMLPNYYDAQRTVRILGEDDVASSAQINTPQVVTENGQAIQTMLNDVTVGEFDITVSAGPSYSTMRLEDADFFTNAMQAAKDPITAQIVTYLAMRSRDYPGAEDAKKMLKVMLPPPVQAVLDEGKKDEKDNAVIQTPKGPLPVAQVPQVLADLEGQLQQAGEALQKSKADQHAAEVMKEQNAAKQLEISQAELQIKGYEAETARMEAQRAADNDQLKAIADAEKSKADQMRADVDLVRSAAENIRAQMEADMPEPMEGMEKPEAPSLEEISQLIMASRQPLNGLTITSPSGQTYSVKMN